MKKLKNEEITLDLHGLAENFMEILPIALDVSQRQLKIFKKANAEEKKQSGE